MCVCAFAAGPGSLSPAFGAVSLRVGAASTTPLKARVLASESSACVTQHATRYTDTRYPTLDKYTK
eukprot:scaffold68635_cov56-Phaeocystis_antarctica.AAC.4